MSPQNATIDDNSPFITYNGWHTGNRTQDTSAFSYLDGGTFTVTQTNGSRASFTFNGTYVYLYGAKRSNHGRYSVELDGVKSSYNGNSGEALFQQLLFSHGPLELDVPHTVHLQCDGSGDDGCDAQITFTTDLGDDDTSAQMTLSDNHPNFSYTGPWTTTGAGGRYEGGTAHQAVNGNSYVMLEFWGESVSLYGAVGPAYGRYTVQMDGGGAQVFDARDVYTQTQVLLYHANNIGNGTHELVLTNVPTQDAPQSSILIDYDVVSTTEQTNITPKEVQAEKLQKLSTGALVGISFGGVVLVAAAALMALWIVRRKKKSTDNTMDEVGLYESRDPLVQPYAYSSGSQTPVTDKGRSAFRGGAQSSTSPVADMRHNHQGEGTLPPDYDMAVGPSSSRVRV
ncbi:hypothetical protein K525DRAFT_186651 [Schizophyllum commune Loenen D]|nr:hypothetical protein K525DRAFT_186651 [Schizophyllum commune Loenen D]